MTTNGSGAPRRRQPLVFAAIGVTLLAGLAYWFLRAPSENTDDAQVSAHVSPVAALVGGRVIAIRVEDNQAVHAGDVVVELDRRDYELALARAEADLTVAEAGLRAARADVPIMSSSARSGQQVADTATTNADAGLRAAEREVEAATAKVGSAEARLLEATAHATRAGQDLARLAPLAAKDEIPGRQLDAAVADRQAADASVLAAEAAVREAHANVDVARARKEQAAGARSQAESQAGAAATAPQQIALIQARASGAEAQVLLARAARDQAVLNLERTTVRAATDGIVSRRSVEVGQVVQAGQPLMSVAALGNVWITANFKETQLGSMSVGQRAEVVVDAYGGRRYAGRVESIAAATGATFSLLPPDNATGNFVKVVQRIPVKIVLDPLPDGNEAVAVLRPGMSVVATVFVR